MSLEPHAVPTSIRQTGSTNAPAGASAGAGAGRVKSGLMALSPDTLIRRTPGAVSRLVGGETIVLDFTSRRFFTLDEVGGRIWELIAEKGTLQEILKSIVAEFDVEPERTREDLEQLLAELEARGLVGIDGVSG